MPLGWGRLRLCWSNPHHVFSHTTKVRLVLPQLCSSCLCHTWRPQPLQHLQYHFCSSSLITNSNWHSWDSSRMNPWSAASSGFDFCTCVPDVKPLNKASATVRGRHMQEHSCLVGTTRVTRSPMGMPECKCLLWSKPLLISFSSDANSCHSLVTLWCHSLCCPPQHSSTCPGHQLVQTQKWRAQCKDGAAGALNQELWGWKSLNEDWESVGCVASLVAETGRGWFLNFSSCNQELPSKS